MKRANKTTVLPMALLSYLGVMAYLGRGYLAEGDYAYYFGVIGVSFVIIVLLYFVLRMREKVRNERDEKIKSTYTQNNDNKKVEN